jgi:Asp-tRNA(Asn)/Glu-tRNA(Gln) amidotransferase B subunit
LLFATPEAQIKNRAASRRCSIKRASATSSSTSSLTAFWEEEAEDAENVGMMKKMLVNVVFGKVLESLQGDQDQKMTPGELGQMIKALLADVLKANKAARRTAAQMIMALDPDVAEMAVFNNEDVREEINWSSARRLVDHLLALVSRGAPDVRITSISDLERMAELAMSRNKETS